MAISGIPIAGCPGCSSRRLALGIGGSKVIGAAHGPLRFQFSVGLQAVPAVEQEPGEQVDGDAARENFLHDLAVAFGLRVAEFFLSLLFREQFGFQLGFFLASPLLGALHLGAVVYRFVFHKTSPLVVRKRSPDTKRVERSILRMDEIF